MILGNAVATRYPRTQHRIARHKEFPDLPTPLSPHTPPHPLSPMNGSMPAPGSVASFLLALRNGTIATIPRPEDSHRTACLAATEAAAATDPAVGQMLHSWHREDVLHIGGPPLAFRESSARHGALLLFRAAWCFLFPATPAEDVITLLTPPCPHASACDLWSADLTLHWLPDLARLCRHSHQPDALPLAIQLAAARWPLSAAALPPAHTTVPPQPAAWESLTSHAGLRQLFTDRALAAQSSQQLAHPEISATARISPGPACPHLAALLPPLAS